MHWDTCELSRFARACRNSPVFFGALVLACSSPPGGNSTHDGGAAGASSLPSTGGSGAGGSGGSMGGSGGTSTATSGGTSPGGTDGSGGSSGGASGGGGGSAPHTVGNCDDLAMPGTWEYIWSDVAPSRTGENKGDSTATAVDPFDAGTVWAWGNSVGLHKSTDCGSTWTKMNTGENGSSLDSGSVVSMAVDPIEPGVMFVTPIYGPGGVWKTTNGGVDWVNMFPRDTDRGKVVEYNHFDSVSMDPSNHLHLVVGTHADCAAPYDPGCHAETTDGGATWTFVKIPGGWQEQAGPFVLRAGTWLYAAPSGLYLTTNRGGTWDTLSNLGFGGGEVENHGIAIADDGSYYLTSYSGIMRSTDAGKSWSLIPNSGGRKVGFALGNGKLFASDQWSNYYHQASQSDPTVWTRIDPPAGLDPSQGAPYLDYDTDHHVLYSSNFAGGLWRLVTE